MIAVRLLPYEMLFGLLAHMSMECSSELFDAVNACRMSSTIYLNNDSSYTTGPISTILYRNDS